MPEFPHLFEPFIIPPVHLKNRITMAPLFTAYAHRDGIGRKLNHEHYKKLASGGVAVIVVANAVVDQGRVLSSFHPEMALFHNFGVNPRNRLCGVFQYASAQFLDLLELVKNVSFLNRKLSSAHDFQMLIYGWALSKHFLHSFRVDDDRFLPILIKLAKTIKKEGTTAVLQIKHGRRFSEGKHNG